MSLATSHAEFLGIRLRHKEDGNDVSNSDFQDSSPLVKVSILMNKSRRNSFKMVFFCFPDAILLKHAYCWYWPSCQVLFLFFLN